ncbi:hypothetical protein QFZ37_003766 [Chryseobacterium ginsenosidimutans]|uniref:hypothetical protein n=1 Tax=Chryseobacterium ginsenosidimutans TaxID=687846 RepID=UPI002788D6B6|nr:hypothetical protein [Chryseobacterium ginsenosidimutans]MDQ0595397.1 hypothetical protein [Chryseobacterium ginsenosidimutans]
MKLQTLSLYDKRILSILLSFLFLYVSGQQITIENKNIFPIEITYKNHIVKLNEGEKKTIIDKEIDYLNIEYDNGRKIISQYIPILLNSNESLNMTIINNNDGTIEFEGDKVALHNLVVNQQHYVLYKNVGNYQDILYKKRNTKQLINFSEFVLADYLIKIKTLNASPLGTEDKIYKRIEKYVINDWVSSLYLVLTGNKTLDFQRKELVLYYYNKYLTKDIQNYNCEYKVQYDVIRDLVPYIDQINITFPKYPIIENTEDNNINQYLPQSCQRFYFKNNYNYFYYLNNPKKDYYKKILKEKFNN